jgi:hypothetical protein
MEVTDEIVQLLETNMRRIAGAETERRWGDGSVSAPGTCERCGDEVATGAARCPACGFEPSSQAGATAVGLVALAAFVGTLVLLVSAVVGVSSIAGFGVPGMVSPTLTVPVAISSGVMLVGYTLQHRRTPADSTLF